MTLVFLSYSRVDSDTVLAFAERLRDAGFQVWLDQNSIQAAVPWRTEITKAIRGSDFVIAAQSDAWRSSSNCAHEYRVAKEYGKSILHLEVTDSSSDWVAAAKAADAQVDAAERRRSALLGDSYRWWQAGRPRTHLVSGAVLRGFRRALRTTSDPIAVDFVRRSSQRVRLRMLGRAILAALTVVLLLGSFVSRRVPEELQSQVSAAVEDLRSERLVRTALQQGPVEGLQVAADLAVTDSWASRSALALALGVHLPTSVENPPPRRPKAAPALPVGTKIPHESGSVTVVPGGVRLEAGASTLMIRLAGDVTALAWGRGGTWFAVATNRDVRVVRASTGREVAKLVGYDGMINGLEWADASTLVGRAGTTRVIWSLPQRPMLTNTGWRVNGLEAGPAGTTLVVGQGGELALVQGDVVRDLPQLAGGGGLLAATATPSGWLVAVSDEGSSGRLVEISPVGELGRSVDIGECDPSGLDVAESGQTVVACLLGDVAVVDVASGSVERLPVEGFQLASLLVDADDTLLATSVYSELLRWTGSDWVLTGQWAGNCVQGARVITASPDRQRILLTGNSVSGLCTQLRNDPTDRSESSRLATPPDIQAFTDAEWSSDGRTIVAVAPSGELWVFDAEHYVTRALVVPTGAALTSVSFLDPQRVLVGSIDGDLVVVDVTTAVADLAGQVAEARRRAVLAEEAGIE